MTNTNINTAKSSHSLSQINKAILEVKPRFIASSYFFSLPRLIIIVLGSLFATPFFSFPPVVIIKLAFKDFPDAGIPFIFLGVEIAIIASLYLYKSGNYQRACYRFYPTKLIMMDIFGVGSAINFRDIISVNIQTNSSQKRHGLASLVLAKRNIDAPTGITLIELPDIEQAEQICERVRVMLNIAPQAEELVARQPEMAEEDRLTINGALSDYNLRHNIRGVAIEGRIKSFYQILGPIIPLVISAFFAFKYFAMPVTTMIGQRSSDSKSYDCRIVVTDYLNPREFSADGIQHADIVKEKHGYRVTLVDNDKAADASFSFHADRIEAEVMCNWINQSINTAQPQFQIVNNLRMSPLIAFAPAVLTLLWILYLFNRSSKVIVDRNIQNFTFDRVGILGRRVKTYAFVDVRGVSVVSSAWVNQENQHLFNVQVEFNCGTKETIIADIVKEIAEDIAERMGGVLQKY